jgi:hypothetical protein
VLRAALPIAEEHQVLFGLALGLAADAPANACRTSRAPVDANVTFIA